MKKMVWYMGLKYIKTDWFTLILYYNILLLHIGLIDSMEPKYTVKEYHL